MKNRYGKQVGRSEPVDSLFRSSCSQVLFKIRVLKNFTIFTGKSLRWKDTPTRVFSCENSKTLENTCFYRTPLVACFLKVVVLKHFVKIQ